MVRAPGHMSTNPTLDYYYGSKFLAGTALRPLIRVQPVAHRPQKTERAAEAICERSYCSQRVLFRTTYPTLRTHTFFCGASFPQ